jgi:DNA-binding FadR family transcriptional regulator
MSVASRAVHHPGATLKRPKRGDLMVDLIKGWVASSHLKPGNRLPKESELQKVFSVSKGTAREALKSLEVQGLVTLKTGPDGGATLRAVPFDRTLQFVQNYFFFREVDLQGIYALRRLLEPELVAGAVPHITGAVLEQLERSVSKCVPAPSDRAHALEQRQEDLHFHSILAEANPNALLGFVCQLLNEMLRQMVVFHAGSVMNARFVKLGQANARAHRAIIDAIRARDPARARKAMLKHIVAAENQVKRLDGVFHSRLLLDSDTKVTVAPPFVPRTGRRR